MGGLTISPFAYHSPNDGGGSVEKLQNIQLPLPCSTSLSSFSLLHISSTQLLPIAVGGIDNLQKGIDWFPPVIHVILCESYKITTRDGTEAATGTLNWN